MGTWMVPGAWWELCCTRGPYVSSALSLQAHEQELENKWAEDYFKMKIYGFTNGVQTFYLRGCTWSLPPHSLPLPPPHLLPKTCLVPESLLGIGTEWCHLSHLCSTSLGAPVLSWRFRGHS